MWNPRYELSPDLFFSVLREQGFQRLGNLLSLYANQTGDGPIVTDVYVDDLIMYGPKSQLHKNISHIRKQTNMEDPRPLGRYLGVQHVFKVSGPEGAQVTEAEYYMSGYFAIKSKAYVQDTGKVLRKTYTSHAPKVDNTTCERNLETPGELTQRQCASHLMGSLYGARMAHPALSVAITRIASHTT